MTFTQFKALVNRVDESRWGNAEVFVGDGTKPIRVADISTTTGIRTVAIDQPPRVWIEPSKSA